MVKKLFKKISIILTITLYKTSKGTTVDSKFLNVENMIVFKGNYNLQISQGAEHETPTIIISSVILNNISSLLNFAS